LVEVCGLFAGIYRGLQEIYRDHHSLGFSAASQSRPCRFLGLGVEILFIKVCVLPLKLLGYVYNNGLGCLGGAIIAWVGVMAGASLCRQFDSQWLSKSL
jgi:hypothetical protein